MHPEAFPRRILLAVTGLNPQVVTETLFGLAVNRQTPFVPTEIHVVTTKEGAERAEIGLLDPKKGMFHQFCRDYGLEGMIRFEANQIHVLSGHDGQPLEDIRSEADNVAAADTITELVHGLSADPDAALHGSLAGGRKTMGFYLAFALSLFGRPQDRLTHVLVSQPFEADPQFYFPPPEPEVLFIQNKPVRTDTACITLADIPFVRLRAGLPEQLAAGEVRYSEVVRALQGVVGSQEMVIDLDRQMVRCGAAVLKFQPQPLAMLAWMARRRLDGQPPVRVLDADPEGFLAEYRRIVGQMAHSFEQARELLIDGDHEGRVAFFREKRTRVNKALKSWLGDWARPYFIHSFGDRPETSYGLELSADSLAFGEVPELPNEGGDT